MPVDSAIWGSDGDNTSLIMAPRLRRSFEEVLWQYSSTVSSTVSSVVSSTVVDSLRLFPCGRSLVAVPYSLSTAPSVVLLWLLSFGCSSIGTLLLFPIMVLLLLWFFYCRSSLTAALLLPLFFYKRAPRLLTRLVCRSIKLCY